MSRAGGGTPDSADSARQLGVASIVLSIIGVVTGIIVIVIYAVYYALVGHVKY